MTRTPSVSIVIPTFNGAAWIADAIGSVLAQTRPAAEVIVVDDGSTDGTGTLLEQFGARVCVIRQARSGRSAARNAGVRQASGDLIGFLDADDRYAPEKLERCVEYLARHPQAAGVLTGLEKFHTTSARVDEHWTSAGVLALGPHDLLVTDVGHPASVVGHAHFIKQVEFPQGMDVSEDRAFLAMLRTHGPVGYIPEPLYAYRVDPHRPFSVVDGRWRRFTAVMAWIDGHGDICPDREQARAAALNALGDEVLLDLYRRDVARFRRERDKLRRVWPAQLPRHRALDAPVYPRWILKMKDAYDSLARGTAVR